MSKGHIRTIADLEASTYGMVGGTGNALLKSSGVIGGFGVPHDATSNPFTAAADGLGDLYNVLYGQKVWSMLNQEVNALSMISKRPYTSSGWRILKSRPAGGSGNAFGLGTTNPGTDTSDLSGISADKIGGVKENAVLGGDSAFRALSPEYTKLYVSPKTVAHLFEFSELGMELAAIDDGVGDIRSIVREDMGKHHAEVQNKMLLMPLEHYDNAEYELIEDNYTSLLKIVSSAGEIAAMYNANLLNTGANNGDNSAVVADVVRIFGTSRTVSISSNAATGTASFLDAEVDFGDGYAAGDARVLTLTMLNDMIRRIRQNGGNPKVILTGYDTLMRLQQLLQSQQRFMEEKRVTPTYNGVKGVPGMEAGFVVATYNGVPIIPSKDVEPDGLSRMYFLDTDYLYFSTAIPTQYFESGIETGDQFADL